MPGKKRCEFNFKSRLVGIRESLFKFNREFIVGRISHGTHYNYIFLILILILTSDHHQPESTLQGLA